MAQIDLISEFGIGKDFMFSVKKSVLNPLKILSNRTELIVPVSREINVCHLKVANKLAIRH